MSLIACVDGLNLALPTGSGIATYGRTLLQGMETVGARTQVLFGPRGKLSRDRIINEIALVDGLRAATPMSKIQRHLRSARAPFGLEATAVPRDNTIVWPDDGAAPVAANDYWVSQDLFRTAAQAFRKSGRFAAVTFGPNTNAPVPEVMHWTSTVPIKAKGVFNIYTIHDIIPLKLPFTTLDNKQQYLNLVRRICEVADHIVVVSETTRRDLIELVGVSEDRVTNTYQAASLMYDSRDQTDISQFLRRAFGLEWKGYFLHYGAVEPKKNLGRVVEAYLRSGVDAPLVIAGATGWLHEPETALISAGIECRLAKGRVYKLDYLPASVLRDLVRGAKACLFPSLYEGFGLPVIEAMMSGTAVLTSTTGSLPEVAADAAVLVDPFSVSAIARGIIALDEDDTLRDEMVSRGFRRAQFFSPELYADRLAALYARLGVGG
ncbi:glycosyltransferase involved in cell wall biosynthesis [Brevundimonas vesicularis]|uniref:glycosyltransferase family 4 protein n=1 Tax=Brevundimonas vesicularis TaxID=41276 RepID=UPI00278639DB|nr:glycosyltransferase family 1 protein [Brevundimonas vesicularis]MDQ1194138.1 glycosyltransferase involved in cell wall biosynthesis [Brevundimonas vesicularis]